MLVEGHTLLTTLIVASAGCGFSILLEQTLQPRPSLVRPHASWFLHIGVWYVLYAIFLIVLERPWFVTGLMLVGMLVLIQVNNAKFRSLNEPFVFHDYEYFTDAIRHPRLYIPFLGWGKFVVISVGIILAIMLALHTEHTPRGRLAWDEQWLFIVSTFVVGAVFCWLGHCYQSHATLNPTQDMQRLGLIQMLWVYARLEHQPLQIIQQPFCDKQHLEECAKPHLIVVQSESFFDPRPLCSSVRKDVLQAFDETKVHSILSGKLNVPAWGANTVRSEFAFLTGISEVQLGVHRFNPYHAVKKGASICSVATYLKSIGYYTVCIHPYWGEFYQRQTVLPRLGFDEFLDIAEFTDAERNGPYISDLEVSSKIQSLIKHADKPLFIYAITMENHGPLHLEKASHEDEKAAFSSSPATDFRELTVYLKHLKNADRMILALTDFAREMDVPVGLCWFGDHVPIMPTVYQVCGKPEGEVEYFIWSNHLPPSPHSQNLSVNQLAETFLSCMKVA